jgi:hypothetical protein
MQVEEEEVLVNLPKSSTDTENGLKRLYIHMGCFQEKGSLYTTLKQPKASAAAGKKPKDEADATCKEKFDECHVRVPGVSPMQQNSMLSDCFVSACCADELFHMSHAIYDDTECKGQHSCR